MSEGTAPAAGVVSPVAAVGATLRARGSEY